MSTVLVALCACQRWEDGFAAAILSFTILSCRCRLRDFDTDGAKQASHLFNEPGIEIKYSIRNHVTGYCTSHT